jgi:flavodoxin
MYIKLLTFLILFSTCSSPGNTQKELTGKPEKILIVYLSRTENTKMVAGMIQDYVGGKKVELQLQDPYPENYQEIVAQVDTENETGYLPPLKTEIDNIDQYDTIFIGFPTWDMQMPPPMKSFLSQYNFSGKTVIPFNTNGGYGVGSGFETVKQLCPQSNILKGFSIKGGLERDGILLAIKNDRAKEVENKVRKWLQEIKVL